ncbi:MAG: hypothetical protein H6Q15_1488 [Bacteroidetes bacterium]|nr:hypothetical protein [Bacteroidota bacterium]
MKHFKIITLVFSIISFSNLYSQSISYPDSSVLSHGNWYKIYIPSSGLYKLTYNDFIALGIPSDEIKSQSLSIFGNGGIQLPLETSEYKNSDLIENSIYVNDPSGTFSQGGYAIFYGRGNTKWAYNSTDRTYSFEQHPYSDMTTYFITFDEEIGEKKRVETLAINNSTIDTIINTSREYFFSKQELNNPNKSGRGWLGKQFINTTKPEDYPLDIKNAILDINNNLLYPAKLVYRVVAQSEEKTSFVMNYNGVLIDTIKIDGIVSNSQGYIANPRLIKRDITTANLVNNKMTVSFRGESTAKGWLDYILVNYDKELKYVYPSVLQYKTTELVGKNMNVQNKITNVTSAGLMVWDVTNFTNPKQISGDYNLSNKTYCFTLKTDTLREVVAFNTNSNFNSVKPGGKVLNQNLHATQPIDYVIITNPIFLEQAERLAKIHQNHNNTSAVVVTTEQIYNEFSSGTPDYMAYREYLRMLYNKYNPIGKAPKNVLLFGDGTFDNKNILKYNNNFVLTWQSVNSLDDVMSYVCEDYITYLSPFAKGANEMSLRDTMMIGVGRFPVNNIEQAKNLVDKTERYLLKKDITDDKTMGDWRNSILLTSDDAEDGDKYFVTHAENIYFQVKETQPQLNPIKVYSDAYKQFASSAGNTYPDASKAINQQMKKGALILNYVGHGSEDHLSSERLITITDIMGWHNYNSMPLIITSTCEFGRFDLVDKPSAGEYTLYNQNGGAIAIITASRKINSDDSINKDFHKYTLEKKAGKANTFGEAFIKAKNERDYTQSENKRSVVLMGDPALKISLPKYSVRTDSINLINPEINIDTLSALSNIRVVGSIVDDSNNVNTDFNGIVQISLYDKTTNFQTLDNDNSGSAITFEQQKNILYKGKTKVVNGVFSQNFTMPKDIAYNYGYGKLSYYAQNDSLDAGGYCNKVIIGGIDNSVTIEETRPLVRLFISDSNFVSGGIADENAEIFAIISDKIAINTVGSGLGHDITATLDNAANTFILNDYFEQDEQNPNKGYIKFPLTSLTEGEHTLTLKAWNIFNYSGSETIIFKVHGSEEETFMNLKNYPNPFSGLTKFYLEHNQRGNINSAQIHIFNSSGRKVKTIEVNTPTNGYTIGPIEWNGTIDGGGKLQAGIYFYRMQLNMDQGTQWTKAEKLVIF